MAGTEKQAFSKVHAVACVAARIMDVTKSRAMISRMIECIFQGVESELHE